MVLVDSVPTVAQFHLLITFTVATGSYVKAAEDAAIYLLTGDQHRYVVACHVVVSILVQTQL